MFEPSAGPRPEAGLGKDIDYDQRIRERAAYPDDSRLDEACFHALETVLKQLTAPTCLGIVESNKRKDY